MVDVHSPEQRSYNMSQIKGKNTKAETLLRKDLYSKGIRGFRVNNKVYGKPDITFINKKIAIFVDGCFWHKCPKCFKEPDTNKKFWINKIGRNIKRDKEVNEILKKEGWKILRFWEHEIKKDINRCSGKIIKELKRC